MSVRLLHYADVENAYDTPERVGRLAGAIAALRDADTLVTGGGDNTGPGVLSLACDGKQALDFYDVVDPDVDVFGNHDFDHGFERARELAAEFPGHWLNANAYKGGERFAADSTTPTATFEVGDVTVGVVGVTVEELVDINPVADGVEVRDAVTAVGDAEADLRAGGADFVVAVSHRGTDDDVAAATTVDAVLGGHEHDERVARVDGTLVARPGAGGHSVLSVALEDEGATVAHHDVAAYEPVPSVVAALRERLAATGLSEPVTRVEEPVLRTERQRKRGESPVGNFVTDAMRGAGDTDVALIVGGIREDDALAGDVTVADLHGLCPFDNDVAVAAVSGGTLLDAFADLPLAARYDDAPEWWFGHVSGASLVYDDRDHSIVEASVGGDPIHPDETYEVALSSYHAETTHVVRAIDESAVVRTAGGLREALVAHAREHGVNTDVEGRIQRPYLDQPVVH
jgi:2',3'-cyclic-nucleotide 2'-phosphodiesterase (5'-nucleotidase family)